MRRLLFPFLLLLAPAQAAPLRAVVFQGDCAACTQAVVRVLAGDPAHRWNTRVSRGNLAAALKHADLFVIPGGNEDIRETWGRLSEADRAAVDRFVRGGGKYLGVCMGAFLAGEFTEEQVGWRWLRGVDTYTGPMRGHPVEALVRTEWAGHGTRWLYFSEGTTFGRRQNGAQVLARYANGEIAALVKQVGKGAVGVVGPHPEADADWYDAGQMGDPDGHDADLLRALLRRLMAPG